MYYIQVSWWYQIRRQAYRPSCNTQTHLCLSPNQPSKSRGEWNKDVLLWAWWLAPHAWPSAAAQAQQEDGEMRSAQLLKPASCRQTRHHAGTGSSHERQSTKIAKYCYDCRRVCCSVWGLRNLNQRVTLSMFCCWCNLVSANPNLTHNVKKPY